MHHLRGEPRRRIVALCCSCIVAFHWKSTVVLLRRVRDRSLSTIGAQMPEANRVPSVRESERPTRCVRPRLDSEFVE